MGHVRPKTTESNSVSSSHLDWQASLRTNPLRRLDWRKRRGNYGHLQSVRPEAEAASRLGGQAVKPSSIAQTADLPLVHPHPPCLVTAHHAIAFVRAIQRTGAAGSAGAPVSERKPADSIPW